MQTKSALIERIVTMAKDKNLMLPSDSAGSRSTPDMVMDSIALLELLVALEQEFQISLMDEELDAASRLKDMDSLASLVMEKLAGADSQARHR